MAAPSHPARRSECPIASSLDVLGDKWTLLVLRDLLDGKTRFKDFEDSPEGIPTNILSDRLRRLELNDLARKEPIPGSKRSEYHVTSKGRDLRPVLLALAAWGNQHLEETWVPPPGYLDLDLNSDA